MKPALLISLLLVLNPSAWAEDGLVSETVFVPPVYFVGDLVEVRLTLLLPEGKALLPPLSLPQQNWVLIRDVQVRHDPPFERVTVKFVPFAPGVKNLPPLVLGDVTLDGVRIATNSILEKSDANALTPPREQMLLPHTELILFLAFLLLIVLPLLMWRFFRPIALLLHVLWKRTDRRRTWKLLNREWKKLQLQAMALQGPEFYTQFSRLVRQYLQARFGEDFQSLTASEVGSRLTALPEAWASEWVRLIHRSDIVRFDNRNPPDREKLDDLESLRRESGRLESKEAPDADV